MEINSETRLCCLIGHPVKHSISPQLHNSAFKHLGLNIVYLSFDIESRYLRRAVEGLKSLNVVGFNVTIPYKVAIIKLLDVLDSTAKETRAVNTVVLKNNELIGYNTDVEGIKRSLLDSRNTLDGRALIIGAGGAARAAVVALKNLGIKEIVIANRRIWRAAALVRIFKMNDLEMKSVSLAEVGRYSRTSSIIINATPIGMWPRQDETPLSSNDIPGNSTVLDLVYNPLKTKLLEEAEKAGAETINGLKPLIEQAVKSFELWTGLHPPRDILWRVAEEALKKWGRDED
ncbi:MAG: shikimate dehydrogenase [Thaumarchaeota archaeon]|jgi:shikimate dehydrogenase|nr:shikimate dehydrogenase [Candidatus Geocrenenecus arthurdayi]MCL7396659.1 shikimate dehydrogenase [Candidatus Geocrenenecus arthurdayi]MCL7403239.1 shikimate dehydrogenase [Candidatus Geocrenenecus arthurdayi]